MKNSAYISLSNLAAAPLSQVGIWGQLLGKLVSARIPVTSSFVIPVTILEKIAEANQLATKLTQTTDKILQEKLFKTQFIPPELARELVKAIHTELLDQQIKLTVSWLPTSNDQPAISLSTQGDANCLESVLELWAQAYFSQITLTPPRLVPAAIILQIELSSTLSGYAITRVADEAKQTIVIHFSHDPATNLSVDVRTWNIVSSSAAPSIKQVPDKTWVTLAQFLHQIRLWSLYNYRVQWQLHQNQVLITLITKVNETGISLTRPQTQTLLGTIKGRPVISGKVAGLVVTDPEKISQHCVLVVRKLEKITPQAVINLGAVVVEEHIAKNIVTILEKYHIPTIINATGANSCFKLGQRILVDATTGLIVLDRPKKSDRTSKNRAAIYLLTHQALAAEQYPLDDYQGVVFQPELTLASSGNHPIHELRSHQKEALFKLMTGTLGSYRQLDVPFFYRLSSFTTDQLRSLSHGAMYEPLEPNPSLGFFGGLRNLASPELLDFELATLLRITPTFKQPLTVIINGCRSPGEVKALAHHLQTFFSKSKACQIWWEVETPEQIFNASAYLQSGIQGIVINAQSLHALSLGIDPANQDVYHRYAWNESLLLEWLRHLQSKVADQPLFLSVTEDQPLLFRLVNTLNLAGLIIRPGLSQVASSYLENYANH